MLIYLYQSITRVNLTLGRLNSNRDHNQMMEQHDFRVFTGVDNKIQFSLRDLDRKPVVLDPGARLMAVVADRYTKVVLGKIFLDVLDSTRGLFQLLLTRDATIDWPVAALAYNVVLVSGDQTQTLLYVDQNSQPRGFLLCQPSLLALEAEEDGNDFDFPPLPANIVNTFRIRLDLDGTVTDLSSTQFVMQIRDDRSTAGNLLANLTQVNGGLNLVYDDGQPYLDLRFGPLTSVAADTTLYYEIVATAAQSQSIILQGGMPVRAGVVGQ